MANKTIKTKYGTVINVQGLSPEQVAKVRQTAEGNGAYGGKGVALADAMRKKIKKTPTTPTTPADPANADIGVDVNAGAVDEDAIAASAPELLGQDDLLADAGKVRDANYAYLSRDFATNKAKELEDKKQELANRGIPLSGDPNSPYGSAIQQIENKYSDLDFQARNQSIAGGNESISTLSNASIGANQAFIKNVLGLTEAELTKYGIDKQMLATLKKIEADKAKGNSGGGGNGVVVGGNAPGF